MFVYFQLCFSVWFAIVDEYFKDFLTLKFWSIFNQQFYKTNLEIVLVASFHRLDKI